MKKEMSFDTMIKLKKLLGNNFILNFNYVVDEEKQELIQKWELYDTIVPIEKNNPIMNSDENTEEELLKFARKNKEYSLVDVICSSAILATIYLFILIALYFTNCEKTDLIRGLIFGNFILECIAFIFDTLNHSVRNRLIQRKLDELCNADEEIGE